MEPTVDRLMLLLLLSNLALLGAPRLGSALGLIAFQGILLGGLALATHPGVVSVRVLAFAVTGLVVRGVIFPLVLRRTARRAGVARELRPLVGYGASVLLGIVMLGGAMALGDRLSPRLSVASGLVVPAALFTIFTGLFLIIARKKALTQCLGYLVVENGIYAFGVATVGEVPALVELGALLDLFVAVLVMGIGVYRISEEFEHMDADRLTSLRG
jgi:hydrogenase-4 component E